ncbi:unnamed protein product [Thlaspi arvense]|uniref:Uncharacterized protein n=1 Tax=Thlaspi arvense TaxID=13288 RepID=A0AAU9SJW5_THLAR|nr:unnamed protein product [Thlaspi arvense]
MTKISFYLAISACVCILLILSPGLLAMPPRKQCECMSPIHCNCSPPPQPRVVNRLRRSVGPPCSTDADCNHFCRPKKGVCNIDFETCSCR